MGHTGENLISYGTESRELTTYIVGSHSNAKVVLDISPNEKFEIIDGVNWERLSEKGRVPQKID